MASLAIRGVAKSFGRVPALAGIDLSVADGEFCVVVGRSGCGKSTLLRAVVGLEEVDAGTIEIDGEVVNTWQPAERDVAMVFQREAVVPGLSVFDNIAFNLLARRMRRADVEPKVRRMAELLRLTEKLGRPTYQLSDEDQQRVALGRALVREAQLCLIDDPLSRLAPEFRDGMRAEIVRLHREFPGTKLYATADPIEAMMLGERTVVMRDGRVEQEGAPIGLFERPATLFVAAFFGSPRMNFLPGVLNRTGTVDAIRLDGGELVVALTPNRLAKDLADGLRVILGIRPEHMMRAVRVSPPDGTLRHDAEIELLQPVGSRIYATFKLGTTPVVAELQAHDATRPGDRVPIDINLKRAAIFDEKTEKAL